MKLAPIIVFFGLAAGTLLFGGAGLFAQDVADSAAPTSSWSQEQWPFPIDQWGTGQAFRCAAERCGHELHLFLRAKIGFCRCATGVSDDNEFERVGDLELFGADYGAPTPGHPVAAGSMAGRARLFTIARPLQSPLPVLTIALAHKCDAIVATVRGGPEAESLAEERALELLRTAAVQNWVEAQGGSQ